MYGNFAVDDYARGVSLIQIYTIMTYIESGVKPHNYNMRISKKLKENLIELFSLEFNSKKRRYMTTYENAFKIFSKMYPEFIEKNKVKDFYQLYMMIS